MDGVKSKLSNTKEICIFIDSFSVVTQFWKGSIFNLHSLLVVPNLHKNQYHILPASQLVALSEAQGIIYIEKPREMYYNVNNGREASCISAVQAISQLHAICLLLRYIQPGNFHFHLIQALEAQIQVQHLCTGWDNWFWGTCYYIVKSEITQ